MVAALPVGGAESLEWAARQLFISTPTHILCALLAPAPPPLPDSAAAAAAGAPPSYSAAAPARLITLAGPGVPVAAAAMGAVVHEGLAPPPMMRPAGPLALLGPRDGCLWAVGLLGQPLAMSLAHPGLRCCSLVAAGDLHGEWRRRRCAGAHWNVHRAGFAAAVGWSYGGLRFTNGGFFLLPPCSIKTP